MHVECTKINRVQCRSENCRWVSIGKRAYELEGYIVFQEGKNDEECYIGKEVQMVIAKFEVCQVHLTEMSENSEKIVKVKLRSDYRINHIGELGFNW